jgi:hypothetical protein
MTVETAVRAGLLLQIGDEFILEAGGGVNFPGQVPNSNKKGDDEAYANALGNEEHYFDPNLNVDVNVDTSKPYEERKFSIHRDSPTKAWSMSAYASGSFKISDKASFTANVGATDVSNLKNTLGVSLGITYRFGK